MALSWVLHSACHVLGYPTRSEDHQMTLQTPENIKMKKRSMTNMKDGSCRDDQLGSFQMPLHYPRYSKAEYEKMEEWKVDRLLQQYGISFSGSLDEKREFAIGTFLWPDQF
ncbi:hypothetical protein CDL15_Pgr029064 [Punica granatum]|uniref:DUF7722 domain-containing protein n=1 Tax=Punica granatum TaxID=22663 RepID=A0A218XME1_PUNGR|nr:hypothetical protein CDL15_Pgr029064 [Punica granatum]PKI60764.1 hypothetical protein CRG98_018847 [Punica granatum]